MKGKRLLVAVAMLALVAGPVVAWAQALSATAKINKSGAKGDLSVLFTEFGLAPSQSVFFTVTCNASANYSCDGVAQAPVGGAAEVDLNLTASSRGSIRQISIIMVPSSPCAVGQTSTLTQASYTNVTVTDV